MVVLISTATSSVPVSVASVHGDDVVNQLRVCPDKSWAGTPKTSLEGGGKPFRVNLLIASFTARINAWW